MKKKNSVVFIVILITIFLIIGIGVAFGYYTYKLKKNFEDNDRKNSSNIAAIASIEYSSSNSNDNNIAIENAYPGKYGYLEFTLNATTKNPKATAYYQIVLNINKNEFKYLKSDGQICENENCEAQVYYALYEGDVQLIVEPYSNPDGSTYNVYKGVNGGKLVTYNSQTIKNDITGKTKEIVLDVGSITATNINPAKKKYTLILWMEDTGNNQNNNQGKNLNGKVDVNLDNKPF